MNNTTYDDSAEEKRRIQAILDADSKGRKDSANVSANALKELQQFTATKDGAKQTIDKMNNFLEEFDKAQQRLAKKFAKDALKE